MDTAIFWIEYVARHKGAVNMKPPTVDMPLYQYLLLDAIFVAVSIIMLIVFIGVKLVSLALSLFVKKSPPTQKSLKKGNNKKNK